MSAFRPSRLGRPAAVLAAAVAAVPQPVWACAACFGKSDSRLAEGMNMGILFLLLVVGFVLSGVAFFFVYLARRSAGVNAPPSPAREPERVAVETLNAE